MLVTNISEAKAQLSALVERVLRGEEVIIGKAGKPVAKLSDSPGKTMCKDEAFLARLQAAFGQ